MSIPESLLLLAGFVFAHAAWNVSDLPRGELLVPLAITEKSGQRELVRFEAATQEEAIAKGKAYLAKQEKNLDAWAFAREGQFKENGTYTDVLTIEAKAKGMEQSIVFVQRFKPFATGQFILLGDPMVIIGGEVVNDSRSKVLLTQLNAGIQSHGKAAPLWPGWHSK